MDLRGPQTLANILEPGEIEQLPAGIQEKLKSYINTFFDEFCKERAAANRLFEAEQKNEEFQNQLQDNSVKFADFEKNVAELRLQLDQFSSERAQLLETVNNHDLSVSQLRKEKNEVLEQRDSLLKVIERQKSEIERVKQDLLTYKQQLSSAIAVKCEAIARVDEIQSKEVALDLKERRLEKENAMLQNEIRLLTSDLNRNNAELQNMRRDNSLNSMHLEVRLKEKTDELQIVQNQNAQYIQTIEEQNKKIEDLNENFFQHNLATDKYVETLKKELDSKEKLVEIFKNTETQSVQERNELLTGIGELKRLLTEATEQYGELEGKFLTARETHANEVAELNKTIESLRTELVHGNELLKKVQEQSLESAICKLAPTAAVASRLIRSDMSLTECYSLYAKTSEELEVQKRENAQLTLQIKSIIEEINERAPVLEQQGLDYKKLVEAHNLLLQQRDELLEKKAHLEHELDNAHFEASQAGKENKKLKQTQVDLSRQVCLLLEEVNCLRVGIEPSRNQPEAAPCLNSNDIINTQLVSFTTITELQEKNVKLLSLLREMTAELESTERANEKAQIEAYEDKLKKSAKKLGEMEDILAQKNTSISTLIAKCERYKKFYFEAQKKLGSKIVDLDDSTVLIDESMTNTSQANASKLEAESKLERRIRSLEQQLEDEVKKYTSLKESYDYYTNEKRKNDAMQQEQFDDMRKEVRQLTSINCKVTSTSEFQKEQLELMQKTMLTYKQQIATLEERNKNYERTIIKHEQTVHMLKDEIMTAHRRQAAIEAEVNSLRNENRMLKDSTARLQAEKEGFHREQQSQSLLLHNLEIIKSNLERSETEGRLRLEQRLDDTVRELSAQRRYYQEEEEKFRETLNEFKRQTETAKKLMEEEKAHAEKLQSELIAVRGELAAKVDQVNELSKKLQDSLTPSMNENPITAANKKARNFELKFEQAQIEIESLNKELAKVREHGEQFYKMSQSAETEIKRLHDSHAGIVATLEAELKQSKLTEAELKTRITDLESELLLSNVTEQNKSANQQTDQLKTTQDELKTLLEKVTEYSRTIRELRAENSSMSESLHAVEMKYANEMSLHSSDIQELAKFKADFLKIQDELQKLRSEREALQVANDALQRENAESRDLLQKEKDDFEQRTADLNTVNTNLHNQIDALTSKLGALTQSAVNPNSSFLGDSSTTELNESVSMDDNKNNEQLLQIIKFLRREKDLCVAKLDILKSENARLLSEHTILQKKVDELMGCLNQERAKSETNLVSAAKHEEVLRKIETLNAITDSNRILRDERNALTKRVAELTERVDVVEKDLFPLQSSNKELTSKIEELNVENTSLRTEAIRWRQRANALVEKSNRNPEEFKRLQADRDNLAKLLTAEKAECTLLRTRVETDLPLLSKQVQMISDDRKKVNDEAATLKQNNGRMLNEIMELKNRLLQKEEEQQKANEELEAKDKLLLNKDANLLQVRRLAKRYKDQCMVAQPGVADLTADVERLRSELEEQNNVVRTLREEHTKLTEQNEELKSRSSLESESAAVVRESKTKIEKLLHDLALTKTELANKESTLAATKSSYDETIARLEKELQEQIATNKEANARLTRDNESLHIRINQLTRQLGAQQSTKPSTSSVGITEKGNISESSPRTANVKPMSGSATVQQSATVTPWRGGETPLASIRPISVQNSRTAAILPTSQQPSAGSASTSTSTSTTTASATGSSSAVGNTALVPPQQQVHTTAGSATLESMASSSPTSSHTDYMPSTSTAAVAVAAIPPMGTSSAAESSQEAESIQHPQQNDTQLFAGGAQQQVVALVSPRVEGSSSSSSSCQTPTSVPSVQISQDMSSQQPSTSGSSSSSSTVVSSHSRHTPSSSSVTTTQAGCSSVGIKRPRDVEGDSSTNAEDGGPEKMAKMTKRLRVPMHSGELSTGHIGDSGIDVDQMPTSSQRDQEDDIVVVDSDEEEDALADADDGPIDGGDGEQEGYEDSYEQDTEMDDGADEEEHSMPADAQDNNEVDIEEQLEQPLQAAVEGEPQEAVAAVAIVISVPENNQQSQAISSGSGETNTVNIPQTEAAWKQSPSTSTAAARRPESILDVVSSPQFPNSLFGEQPLEPEVDGTAVMESAEDDRAGTSVDCTAQNQSPQKPIDSGESSETDSKSKDENKEEGVENESEADEAFNENTADLATEDSLQLGIENQNVGTSQSEMDNMDNQGELVSDENEGTDGVSSEGEKQAVEGVEEEGREAEASTSPSENTRSRTLRSTVPPRRNLRASMRGNHSRPTPIVWQGDASSGNIRNHVINVRTQDQVQPGSPANNRLFQSRARGRRTMRRPSPNNYSAPRYP